MTPRFRCVGHEEVTPGGQVAVDMGAEADVGTVAACKLLGIGRETGYRWRAENGGLPPAR
jgi:hypothetical protein